MNLFECSIFTFSNEIFNRKVLSVKFVSLEEGEITVLARHEDYMFFLSAGKITIQMRDVKGTKEAGSERHGYDLYSGSGHESFRSFYNGSGYVKITDGKVFIFALPIIAEDSLNREAEAQMHDLGDYGKHCYNIWRKSKLV